MLVAFSMKLHFTVVGPLKHFTLFPILPQWAPNTFYATTLNLRQSIFSVNIFNEWMEI